MMDSLARLRNGWLTVCCWVDKISQVCRARDSRKFGGEGSECVIGGRSCFALEIVCDAGKEKESTSASRTTLIY